MFQNLTGDALFQYFVTDYPDRDYRGVVALLPYATGDEKKAFELREGKRLISVYPGVEEIDTSLMEYIGAIIDGGLFLK